MRQIHSISELRLFKSQWLLSFLAIAIFVSSLLFQFHMLEHLEELEHDEHSEEICSICILASGLENVLLNREISHTSQKDFDITSTRQHITPPRQPFVYFTSRSPPQVSSFI